MVSAQFVSGGFDDNWTSCDASFSISEPAETIDVTVFIPENLLDDSGKWVALTDGNTVTARKIDRGEPQTLRLVISEGKSDLFRLISEPELNSEGEERSLGVLVASIKVDQDGSELPLSCSSDAADDVPGFPGYWECYDAFDRQYYRQQLTKDIENLDPLLHYLAFGWRAGLEPNRFFDSKYYVEQAYDTNVKAAAPLLNFVRKGRFEGWRSSELSPVQRRSLDKVASDSFAETQFVERLGDLLSAIGADTSSLVAGGPFRYIVQMFDAENYRARHQLPPSMVYTELLTRYILFGYPLGEEPGPLFDEDFYRSELKKRKLSANAETSAFLDWLRQGIKQKISPTALFDEDEYVDQNPDLKNYHGWVFEHWLLHGLKENRKLDSTLRVSRNFRVGSIKTHTDTSGTRGVITHLARSGARLEEYQRMRDFRLSEEFENLLDEAVKTDPAVGILNTSHFSMIPPFFDEDYQSFKQLLELVKEKASGHDVLITLPFCKLGGADYVAGTITSVVEGLGLKPLVLRTELSDWERPDWFPENVDTIDVSKHIRQMPPRIRERVLYEVIRHLAPKAVININSRLAFDTFELYGERLKIFTKLYCYFFCADLTEDGHESGYPVWFFATILPHLERAFIDTKYLADNLKKRFSLPDYLENKVLPLYTPAMQQCETGVVAEAQVKSSKDRKLKTVLWAGRFDRQKRFDLLVDIARAMPTVQFKCWGKAVLDAPPNIADLPTNLKLHAPFRTYDDLPIEDCDGWLYTSSWDGLPTILIELGKLGMPIVASAAGGIPELIHEEGDKTGWSVDPEADVQDYVQAIKRMINNPKERIRRAQNLQSLVNSQHSVEGYNSKLEGALLKAKNND